MILSSISFAFLLPKAIRRRSPLYPYTPIPLCTFGARGDLIFDFRRRRGDRRRRRGDLIFDFRRRRGDLSFAFLRRKAQESKAKKGYGVILASLSYGERRRTYLIAWLYPFLAKLPFGFLWRCVPLRLWRRGKKGIGVILASLSLHLTLWLDLIRYKVHRIALYLIRSSHKVRQKKATS